MQPARKQLEYIADPNKFDLIVDRWDSQGHRVGNRNTYRKFILNGQEYYERPVNSGNLWLESNKPAGRVLCTYNDQGHIVTKEFDHSAAHVAFVPAPTGAQKLAQELEAAKAEVLSARAELDAIRKEREAKPAVPAKINEHKDETPTLSRRG